MEDAIKMIIKAGIQAPSGENCQPWNIVVRGYEIELWNIPARDDSLYSWGQRASLIAHGAFLENASIAASRSGHEMTISLFPDRSREDLIARVVLKKSSPRDEPLCSSIPLRVTNRKPYSTKTVPLSQIRELQNFARDGARVRFVTERSGIERLAAATSTNEKVLFKNKHLHRFFFGHLMWSEDENLEKSIGLYVKTLELPPPAVPLFKAAGNWGVLQVLNFIGFSSFIAKANAKIYASSGAFGAVTIPTTSKEDFVAAGRLMERTWLAATQAGLSVQPLTGVLFLMLKIRAGDDRELTDAQKKLVRYAYELIESECGAKDRIVAMLFRLGEGGAPTARSSRFAVEQFVTKDTPAHV